MKPTKTTLLLDADIICYKFASKAQENFTWSEEVTSSAVSPLEDVVPHVAAYIEELQDTLNADDVIVCLTAPENFRYQVLPTYKGNRKDVIKPELLGPLKATLAERYTSYTRPGLEADDVMGILSTHPTLIPGKKIIVSTDKDMKQIPGWLYNPDKDDVAGFVEEPIADLWFYTQVLTGDTTDGYKGCPGIGPTKARRILAEAEGDFWRAIVSTYETKGLTEEDALVQARVARICRHTDYDFKHKEVRLWTP